MHFGRRRARGRLGAPIAEAPMSRLIILAVLLVLALSVPSKAQQVVAQSPDGLWSLLDRMPAEVTAAPPWIRTGRFAPAQLDFDAYGAALAKAPPEAAPAAAYLVIWLPMPD